MRLPKNPNWVSVDTETSGLHPDDGARIACVALTWPEGEELKTLALPFDQGIRDKLPTKQLDLLDTGEKDSNLGEAEWNRLLGWLSKQSLVMHNAKFDLTMFRAGTREWPGRDLSGALFWDTFLGQRILDPIERAGLDEATKRLGLADGKQGLDGVQGWLKKNKFDKGRYDLVPWEIIEPYVATDTELTAKLFRHQLQRFKQDDGLRAQMGREMRLLKVLFAIEGRGVPYDAAASLQVAERLEERLDELRKAMEFDPRVTKSVHNYFCGTLGLVPARTTEKTNKPQIDAEQLRDWIKMEVAGAKEFDEYRRTARAISMWYRGYPDMIGVDGRLRGSFKQAEVRSGRLGIQRAQLQAIPKSNEGIEGASVRSLLRPPEGYGLWSLDLSQAELRVAAHYARCQRMLEMLLNGADLHSETCKGVLKAREDEPGWKLKRDIAKRLNFGGIFQIGPTSFQENLRKLADIHLPIGECQSHVYGWRRMYPEFGYAYTKAERLVQQRGWVRLLPNTKYEVRSYFGEFDYANTGWSRVVQGSLAEAFKLLLIKVEENWPGYLILTVHDSIVLECRENEGDEIAAQIAGLGAKLMTDLFRIEMKMDVDRWS